MKIIPSLLTTAALLTQVHADIITHGGNSITMEFVGIQNVGNAALAYMDNEGGNQYSNGAVDYEYSIGKYEVTSNQWAAVVAASSMVEDVPDNPWSGDQPTANVSFHEAAKFANWLTSGDALKGVYQFSNTDTLTGIDRTSAMETYGIIYAVPTEDEWFKAAYFKSDGSGYTLWATGDPALNGMEYVCETLDGYEPCYIPDGINSAGDMEYTSVCVGGSFSYNQDDQAYEFWQFSPQSPYEVGGGAVENNGTYDMGGNVAEWTETLDRDPTERRVRGGGFGSYIDGLTHQRLSSYPTVDEYSTGDNRSIVLGFRVVRIASSIDTDGDGCPDDQDPYPNSLTVADFPIVDVGNVEIENVQVDDCSTLADLIDDALNSDHDNADLVVYLQAWRDAGYLTGREMGQIIRENNTN